MMKQMMILAVALVAFPALSETNELKNAEGEHKYEHRKDGNRDGRWGKGDRREMTEEEREAMKEHRLQMMEKTLKELGVTEEQQQQISELQTQMKEQMRAAYMNIEDKKNELRKLEEVNAPQDEIFKAIDEVADAQADLMKILARNRIQMERILGKEKFELFMDKARHKWKEHGRRGGQGMPPMPGEEKNKKTPQTPPTAPPTP